MPRRVVGIVDGKEGYFARVAAGGGYVFLSANPVDASGRIADEARPADPYQLSPAAQVTSQTKFALDLFHELLPEVGSSLRDTLQLEQYVKTKLQSDGYFRTALSADYLGGAHPVGATAEVGGFFPEFAAFGITGLAVAPDESSGFVKSYPGDPGDGTTAGRRFSQITAAGPYAFMTVFPSDGKTGVPKEAKLPAWIWSGSEIRSEAEWAFAKLETTLSLVGATLSDIVDYTLFLTDVGDLFEFDSVLASLSDAPPPSRTVIPTKGFALPRREGAYGHEQGAPRMEIQLRVRIPDKGAARTIVEGPGHQIGHQSAGVSVGPLLWISSQPAEPSMRGDIDSEVADIMAKLGEVASAGGTDISQTLRLRALVTDPTYARSVYSSVRASFPNDPPCVSIVAVSSPLAWPGASVAMDAVAYLD